LHSRCEEEKACVAPTVLWAGVGGFPALRAGLTYDAATALAGEERALDFRRHLVVSHFGSLGQHYALYWDLATRGTVKYAPQGQIVASVLELMLGRRSHEQDVARLERIPLAVVNEHPPAANDEVNLVLRVRRLLARAQREGKGYVKWATPQDHDGVLTRGSRDTRSSLGKADNTAAIWGAHASLLVPSD
jgi:hypothetical protein